MLCLTVAKETLRRRRPSAGAGPCTAFEDIQAPTFSTCPALLKTTTKRIWGLSSALSDGESTCSSSRDVAHFIAGSERNARAAVSPSTLLPPVLHRRHGPPRPSPSPTPAIPATPTPTFCLDSFTESLRDDALRCGDPSALELGGEKVHYRVS